MNDNPGTGGEPVAPQTFTVGERWGYRARAADVLTEVRIARVGEKRPPRILIEFVGDDAETKREWVPPNRLKVLWANRDSFLESEQRWAAVRQVGPDEWSAEDLAADYLMRRYVARRIAEYESSGFARVYDLRRLAALADTTPERITGHDLAFTLDDSAWVVPWPRVEPLVRTLAVKHADEVLTYVRDEEDKFEFEALHGREGKSSIDDMAIFISPQQVRDEEMETHHRPLWNILRDWTGSEIEERLDELVALRQEIYRVGEVTKRAIRILRMHGLAHEALYLERDLGIPAPDARSKL